jgi:hypothetical protein
MGQYDQTNIRRQLTKLAPLSRNKVGLITLEEAVLSTKPKTVACHFGSVLDQRIVIKAATRRTWLILSVMGQLTAARF